MKAYERSYFGSGKDGKTFFVDRSGSIDVKGIKAALGGEANIDRMWKRYIHSYEEMLKLRFYACSIVYGKQIDKTRTLLDLKGFSVAKLWSKETKNFVKYASSIG